MKIWNNLIQLKYIYVKLFHIEIKMIKIVMLIMMIKIEMMVIKIVISAKRVKGESLKVCQETSPYSPLTFNPRSC